MATYIELRNLYDDDDLKNKLDVATMITANNLLSGTPTVDQQKWAAYVFGNVRTESSKALMAVLATNNNLTVAQIQTATDNGIQTAVDAVADALVVAYNA